LTRFIICPIAIAYSIKEVEIWSFCACAVHPAIIIGTVGSLWIGYGADTAFHRTYF